MKTYSNNTTETETEVIIEPAKETTKEDNPYQVPMPIIQPERKA